MPFTQLTQYTSNTIGSPPLNGRSGSLINVLDFCLVSGSGWAKTFNSASSTDGANVFAAYRPPSGSRMTLFVNDSGANQTIRAGEAWIMGYENFQGLGEPAGGDVTSSIGSGSGQFPLTAQSSTGHLAVRKSSGAGTSPWLERPWYLFADAYTMYMFPSSEGNTTLYFMWGFGDIFSLKGTDDVFRCMIFGREADNSTTMGGGSIDNSDTVCGMSITANNSRGSYLVRTSAGIQTPVIFNRHGNISWNTSATSTVAVGTLYPPNIADGSFFLAPIHISENLSQFMRGRLRGLYYVGHPFTSFVDGQTFQGINDYAGKTFQIITPSASGTAYYCIEISNTVEAN
jgi:hypothetical protein